MLVLDNALTLVYNGNMKTQLDDKEMQKEMQGELKRLRKLIVEAEDFADYIFVEIAEIEAVSNCMDKLHDAFLDINAIIIEDD